MVEGAWCHDIRVPRDKYALEYQNAPQAFSYCLLKKCQRVPNPLISVWRIQCHKRKNKLLSSAQVFSVLIFFHKKKKREEKKERREMQTKKLVPHLILNSIYFGAYGNKQPKATESNAVVLAKDNCTASNIYLRQDSVLFNQKHLQRIFCSTQMSTET